MFTFIKIIHLIVIKVSPSLYKLTDLSAQKVKNNYIKN